jgi:serine/threonine-protein kinase
MDALGERLHEALADRYAIDRELGGGGMSRVFLATEIALGRPVVIKVIAAELLEGVSADRFAREVKLAARLQQANIVPLLSAGDAQGIPYYTMPFIRGETLRARLDSGPPFSLGEAVHLLRDVARALAYAHGESVVHRDIKPENIMLSGGAAVVTDFGIAKALTVSRSAPFGEATRSGTLTEAGSVIGTPAYMAPEQVAGDANIDHRADIYSWGVVAWEVLAGKHPFSEYTTAQALLVAHLSDTPPLLNSLRPGIPREFSVLIARCLAKDPAERPQSAGDILASLDRMPIAIDGGPGTTRPNWKVAAVALVALIVASAAWYGMRVASPGRGSGRSTKSLVILPFESFGGDTANRYFAEGMADEVATALAKTGGLQLAGRNSAAAFAQKRSTVQEIGRTLGVGAVLQGAVRRSGNRLRVSAELSDATNGLVIWTDTYEREMKDVFSVQDDIAREIVAALRVKLGESGTSVPVADRGTRNLAAYDDYLRGLYFYQRRGPAIPKAVAAFSAAIERDSGFARAWAGLGLALTGMTIFTNTPAMEVLPKALRAAAKAEALDPHSAEAFLAEGNAHAYSFEWPQAEAAYRHSVALDSTLALSRLWYGRYLWVMGRYDEAAEQLQRATNLDPLNATNSASLSLVLAALGRRADAVATAQRAFEMDSTLLVAQWGYVFALSVDNRAGEARAIGERLLRASQEITTRGVAAYAVGRGGDVARARELIAEFRRREGEWRSMTALLRAASGIKDTTVMLDAMERGVPLKDPFPLHTSLGDAVYDPVRSSPRFAAIVRSLGMDPSRFTVFH